MVRVLRIDLNCDLGEGYGSYQLGEDGEMMKWISSANVACGFHAGDPDVIAKTVALAKENGVALGAHPGYPDLQGFGRRPMALSSQSLANVITYQLGGLDAIARVTRVSLAHVKPHGALYNLAAVDVPTAQVIAGAVSAYDPNLILVGLAGSELVRAGRAVGLRVAQEGFPDRGYTRDGQLTPRGQVGAVITAPEDVARNAVRLAQEGICNDGETLRIDTLCLHGDHPAAVENARQVREALERAGVEICPLAQVLAG
jgi:UPF0271 protein